VARLLKFGITPTVLAAWGAAAVWTALPTPPAGAGLIPLGDASNYAALYEGGGGKQLSISNVTINGNVGSAVPAQ
jgi:hypothetical protein